MKSWLCSGLWLSLMVNMQITAAASHLHNPKNVSLTMEEEDSADCSSNVCRRTIETVALAAKFLKGIDQLIKIWDLAATDQRSVGIRLENRLIKMSLEKPRWYMRYGMVAAIPPYRVLAGETAFIVFSKKRANKHGASASTKGLLAYELINESGIRHKTLMILWKVKPDSTKNEFRVWVEDYRMTEFELQAKYMDYKMHTHKAQGSYSSPHVECERPIAIKGGNEPLQMKRHVRCTMWMAIAPCSVLEVKLDDWPQM